MTPEDILHPRTRVEAIDAALEVEPDGMIRSNQLNLTSSESYELEKQGSVAERKVMEALEAVFKTNGTIEQISTMSAFLGFHFNHSKSLSVLVRIECASRLTLDYPIQLLFY